MHPPISPVGKKLLAACVLLWIVDILVLIFAIRVNVFQEFFFMADLFPLGLAIATFIAHFLTITADLAFANAFMSRPVFKLGVCFVFSVLWLSFNVFSTVRWKDVPILCSSVPSEYPDEQAWCEDVQALKSFVWIYFVGSILVGVFIARYIIVQYRRGNRHIWSFSLVRFDPRALQDERTRPVTFMTDYFASTPGNVLSGPAADHKW